MGKKAKAKPMRLWIVLSGHCARVSAPVTRTRATQIARMKRRNGPYPPYRVVEFVAVTPRKRQKGKK